MPSALETLVKILKLEREQGCNNKAVIGGFAAYSVNWQQQAKQQARRREHHILVIELTDLLKDYEDIESQVERLRKIDYMLDRIVGRAAPPEKYEEMLDTIDVPPPPPPKENHRNRGKSSRHSSPPQKTLESYGYDNFRPMPARKPDIPQPVKLARPPRNIRKLEFAKAKERLEKLQQPVTNVKGIGASIAEKLDTLGISTIDDLLHYLPRRYDDYTQLMYISKLQPDTTGTVIGTVDHTEVRAGRNGRKDFFMVLDDGSGKLNVTFFGQHFLIRNIRVGKQVVVSGRITTWQNRLQMTNPEWEMLDNHNLHTTGIVPVYPLTQGLTARRFRRLMKNAIDEWAKTVPEYVPKATLERTELADINWTFKNLHFPGGADHLEHARRRYVFDQLLTLQLGILENRRDWQSVPGQSLPVEDGFLDEYISAIFPYDLTGAQNRAIMEIRQDLAKDVPMNRLLQGDVGAGKTAVAVTTIGMALHNRKQAALMAPTSILAEQHYRGISKSLDNMPGDFRPVVALLTGSLTTTERQSIYRGMADGSIDVVIGTHALIQEGVEFKDLGVAIIDEQHRFGVEQRGALRGKGSNPHLLVMTATPIPRTLALTMYADLDLSIIDEKPPGRQPVETRVLTPFNREIAFDFIEAHVKERRQAFIIHPLVEASEKVDARSAVEAYEELTKVYHRYRVCLLHGRMSPSEKDEIMAAFANHEYDIMVTTSVAEVGVDVPNATVIVIEGANRFGLAQLHQFRGRVGRGEHKSFCLLIPDNNTPESEERLRAMEATNDGFRLAEMDWNQRGAGDLLGTRQSGTHLLKIAQEATPKLVKLAQQEARTIYEEDPYLEQEQHQLLAEMVNMLKNDDSDVS